jgi:hypothetical protein
MNPLQNCKFVTITPPRAILDNSSWTTAEIDTAGWDYMTIVAHLGATDIAMAALAVTESDATGSGHANVTGLIWGTSTNIDGSTSALPIATDDNTFQVAEIDLRGRKRFIDVTATNGDGTVGGFICIIAILSRGDNAVPITIAGRGCDEILRV